MEKNRQHIEELRTELIGEIQRRSNRKEGTEELDIKLHRLNGAWDLVVQLSARYTLVDRNRYLKMVQWIHDASRLLTQYVDPPEE